MDAEHLEFPDNSFDVVVAQYVVTTVPNPEATLDEFARVLKPGGEIVLLSRVGAEAGLRRNIEHWFAAGRDASCSAGAPSSPFARYSRWAAAKPDMRLVERRPMPPLGHFSLIRFAKIDPRRRVRPAERRGLIHQPIRCNRTVTSRLPNRHKTT